MSAISYVLRTMKGAAAALLDRDPRVSVLAYAALVRCPWLLPHDESYLGVVLVRRGLDRHGLTASATPVILDIGANNGISSRGFLKLLPGWNVIAIEANAVHAASLGRLTGASMGRFRFILGAAGNPSPDSGAVVSLYTPVWKRLPLHTSTATDRVGAVKTAAQVWKLDPTTLTVLESTSPSIAVDDLTLNPLIVKLDAEGSEAEILRGMVATIARTRPAILMEITADRSQEAASVLADLDYDGFDYDPNQNRLVPWAGREADHVTGSRNRYFLPRERRFLAE